MIQGVASQLPLQAAAGDQICHHAGGREENLDAAESGGQRRVEHVDEATIVDRWGGEMKSGVYLNGKPSGALQSRCWSGRILSGSSMLSIILPVLPFLVVLLCLPRAHDRIALHRHRDLLCGLYVRPLSLPAFAAAHLATSPNTQAGVHEFGGAPRVNGDCESLLCPSGWWSVTLLIKLRQVQTDTTTAVHLRERRPYFLFHEHF